MKTERIYIDTSIIGGCFDEEFSDESRKIIEEAKAGRLILIISDILAAEIAPAPPQVVELYASIPETAIERVRADRESVELMRAYMKAEVVGPNWEDDAHHVALATVCNADMIVSWNFKHIVNYQKIRGFNAVNMLMGYGPISIHSPLEIIP